MANVIRLPNAGIVLMVGPSSCGKTTLLNYLIEQRVIQDSEVISSDQFRLMVSDKEFIDWRNHPKEEADILYDEYQRISKEAFEAMNYIIEKRCRLNKLTMIDATHLYAEDRMRCIETARRLHVPVVAVALNVPEETLLVWDETRDYPRGKKRIKQQVQTFNRQLKLLKKEGYSAQYILQGEDVQNTEFYRKKNRLVMDVGNGIDFIGDIHGCFDELIELLARLGYVENEEGYYVHPDGRKFLSVGDVMSRGPQSLVTMQFFQKHLTAGLAYMIDSNHGWKIARWLDGRSVKMQFGDEKIVNEFETYEREYGKEAAEQLKQVCKQFLLKAPSHYVIQKNGVNVVVVTHAGIRDEYIGKHAPKVSDFCRYGDTDGFDENGRPIRKDWHIHHKTSELIIWGHDPKPKAQIINRTINIDQGVVFGGSLTAFRYPEKQFIAVKAKENYSGTEDTPLHKWEKKRLAPPNIMNVIDGYSVVTDHFGEINIQAKFVTSALDDLSHFTVPLEELIYIPPTMSPTPKASRLENYLEHPTEAYEYYRMNGVQAMIAQKKHMGSRGILLLFKDKQAAKQFVGREILGVIYTRTGRRFFSTEMEQAVLKKLNHDLKPYFVKYATDFVLLDAEILPWNLKARELIRNQYAHVGEMAQLDRTKLWDQLLTAVNNGVAVDEWLSETAKQLANTAVFRDVFQNYIWETNGLEGIQIAPFHTLAHSGRTFFDQTHLWHMGINKELSQLSDLFIETEYRVISDEISMKEATKWWEHITEDGHEGFVVKPFNFMERSEKGKLLQPAIKVRGVKYLHIIYGIDYLHPPYLQRLKQRNTGKKQRKALREFALGLEGIQRFVSGESLERIHECVLGTLAMEAEAVDPRL